MQKRLTSLALLLIVLALSACHAVERSDNAQHLTELSAQDFETAYELGKLFIRGFYEHKAGRAKIDYSRYIANENLLKYSNRRNAVETHVYDIKEIFVGVEQARFVREHKCFQISYVVYARDSNIGGFSDMVEMLISTADGRLVVADWYIACGAGISSFDEAYRPNTTIDSPDIWNDHEYVKSVFKRIGIE